MSLTPEQIKPHKCAVCNAALPMTKLFFCEEHWWKVPAADRVALYNMQVRKQDMASKVCAIVRKMKK